MMQARRELDAKVAEALGYTREERMVAVNDDPWNGYVIGERWYSHIPHFSTDWGAMGVLVEEARKQGVYLEYSHSLNGGYYGGAYSFDDGEYQIDYSTEQAVPTAPHAVALVYLMAKGVIANA